MKNGPDSHRSGNPVKKYPISLFFTFFSLNELPRANKTKLRKSFVQLIDMFIIWFLNRRVSGIVRNAADGSYAQL